MDCITGSSSSSKPNNNNSNKKKKSIGKKISKGVKLSTDPQSVAARQRRHRISDRFKILQSMVPGGSKMDTVSMLEEAIHYVKFLKAQIWLHHNMMTSFVADDVSVDESWLMNSHDPPMFLVPDHHCYVPNYEQNNVVVPLQQSASSSMENLCNVFLGEGTTIDFDALNHWPA